MGFFSCNKQAPNPFVLASVCSPLSFLGLWQAKTGALTISFLGNSNESWCSRPQLNGTFSFTSSLIGSASSVNLGKIYCSDFTLSWFVAICCVGFPIEIYLCALVLEFFIIEPDIALSCRLQQCGECNIMVLMVLMILISANYHDVICNHNETLYLTETFI